jgi:hypothetical protein
MKDVAPHDRPREKLERLGPSGLGDNELLALVLGGGLRGRGALDLANRLIEFVGGLPGLTRVALSDLCSVPGVGRAKAAQVIAAVEFGRRTLVRDHVERPRFTTPGALAAASRNTSRGWTMVESSEPVERSLVRITRLLVSSSTRPKCSTDEAPYNGSRYAASAPGVVNRGRST